VTAASSIPNVQGLLNPTRSENWPPDPTTEEEFASWMHDTKQGLLKWLREAQALAQDEASANNIRELTKSTNEIWKRYDTRTDGQTGEKYNEIEREQMEKAMRAADQERQRMHTSLATWGRAIEYRMAQTVWEDFLYYQNVWNRKTGMVGSEYTETPAEKKSSRAEGGRKKGQAVAVKARKKTRNPVLGTPGSNQLKRQDELSNGAYGPYYEDWRANMMRIYNTFSLGSRKRMPDCVGPENAHRYTQPPRSTIPQTLLQSRKRLAHLEERFPRKKRIVTDASEVEEEYRTRNQIEGDKNHEIEGHMIAIDLVLDENALREQWEIIDNESGYRKNSCTRQLLPKEHQLHHGCTETSLDWPTSFDSRSWGDTLSKTGIKRMQAYEDITDTEGADQGKTRGQILFKRDENGDFSTKSTMGRYQTRTVVKPEKVFVFDTTDDGNVVGRDRSGVWHGHWTDGEVEKEEFVLDPQGQRVPESPKPVFQNIFTTTVVTTKYSKANRYDRHESNGTTDQLSDDECEGRVKASTNFGLSGNANSSQMGKQMCWGDNNESNQLDGGSDDENLGHDDEESDDEGDLFKQSYEECLGTDECHLLKKA
jgi:hypothetical protein